MTKDNPNVFVQDNNNGRTTMTIEGMISFSPPTKAATEMARQILFKEERP